MTRKMIATIVAFAVGLMMVVMGASPASATEPNDCVPTDDVYAWFVTDPGSPWEATGKSRVKTEAVPDDYTDWVATGEPVVTEENEKPVGSSDTVKWEPLGSFVDEANSTEDQHYSLVGGAWKSEAYPAFPDPGHPFRWQASTGQEPHGDEATFVDGPGNRHYTGEPGNSNWFAFTAGVTDYDYKWQKYTRTFVPGSEAVIEYEYVKKGNDCPPPDEPEETTAAAPTFYDPCGVTRDKVILPEDDRPEVQYDISYREEGNALITIVTAYVPDEYKDEYVLKGQTVWEYIFDDIGCPDPEVNKGEKVETFKTSSYECGDAFKVVKTVTLTTPWTQAEGEDKVYGETVRTVERERIPVEVVPCDTDEPKEPNTPVATPDEPKDKATPAVPTSVDAGLASVDTVAKKKSADFDLEDFPFWAVILFLVIVGIVVVVKFFLD